MDVWYETEPTKLSREMLTSTVYAKNATSANNPEPSKRGVVLILGENRPCCVSFVSLFVLDPHSHGNGIRTTRKTADKIGCLSWQGHVEY